MEIHFSEDRDWSRPRKAGEYDYRAPSRIEQNPELPYHVTVMGMLDYFYLTSHATKEEAEQRAQAFRDEAKAAGGHLAIRPISREVQPGEITVRTQEEWDAVTRAILDSYSHEDRS